MKLLSQPQLLSLQDGLSNRDITCVIQSRNGYMLVGTGDGLNRYDGNTFILTDKSKSGGGKIKCLYEDTAGMLWIGSWDGLSMLNQRTGNAVMIPATLPKGSEAISDTRVNCLIAARDGGVLAAYGNGHLCAIDSNGMSKLLYKPENKRSEVTAVETSEDATWIVTDFNRVTRLGKDYLPDPAFNSTVNTVAGIVHFTGDNHIYLFDRWGDVFMVSATTGENLRSPALDSLNRKYKKVTAVQASRGKSAWIGYDDGAIVWFDFESGRIVDHTTMLQAVLRGPARNFCEDRCGALWIGSNFGLVKYVPVTPRFSQVLALNREMPESLKVSMRGMCEMKNGDICFASYKGLFRYEKNTGKVIHQPVKLPPPHNISAYYPYRLVSSGEHLWVGTEVKGLFRYHQSTGKVDFPLRKHSTSSAPFRSVYSMVRGGGDSLLMGTNAGIFIYRMNADVLTRCISDADKFDISNQDITALLPLGDELWIGTRSGGLYVHRRGNGIYRKINPGTSEGSLKYITSLAKAGDNELWVGTRGDGVYLISSGGKIIRRFTAADGLADNTIASVVTDKSGKIWIATFNGLSRYDTETGTFSNFHERDGLSHNEFNHASYLVSESGTIFLGGLNGVTVFDPAAVKETGRPTPRIFLTKVARYNGSESRYEERTGDLHDLVSLSLGYRDKFFSIGFALDDYLHPPGNTFSYFLEGLDNDWHRLGTQGSVRFDALPAGDYTLHVKGVSSTGVGSGNTIKLNIQVAEAFYRTWWFYALVLSFTAALAYLVTNVVLRQRFKVSQIRTKLSSDLHDEVGSLLTRVTMEAELMKQGLSGNQTLQSAEKIARSSRQATEAMDDILWSIDARNDNLSSVIDKLREYAHDLLDPLGIAITFHVETAKSESNLRSDTRQNLLLIFKEAIHNVARHSGAKNVFVTISDRNGAFELMIVDDGSGFTKDIKPFGNGQGLKNMRLRAERIGGVIQIDAEKGTKLVLKCKKIPS